MESRLLLDVIVTESATILELLAGEDEALLVGWDALLVLDLGLNVIDGVRRLDLESDSLSGERLHEDLHATTEAEDQVKSGLLLNVVVRKGAAVLQLLSSKDQTLLIRGNTFLILNLSLDVVNGIRWFNVQGDGLTSQCLDKDLHTTT